MIRNINIYNQQWDKPSGNASAMWNGFLRSKMAHTGNRRAAKCTHCSVVIPDARYETLLPHAVHCPATSQQQKDHWIIAARSAQVRNALKRKRLDSESSNTTVSTSNCDMNDHQAQLTETLLMYLISSDTPLSFVQNPHLKLFVERLTMPGYEFPTRKNLVELYLPNLCTKFEQRMNEELNKESTLTLSVDSFSDGSRSSFYSILFLANNCDRKFFIRNVALFAKQDTQENLLKKVYFTLLESHMERAKAIVTGVSSTLAAFVEAMCTGHKHLVPIKDALFAFDDLSKDIIKYPLCRKIIRNNLHLVKYLASDTFGFWCEKLSECIGQHPTAHLFPIASESRYLNFCIISISSSINALRRGFENCLKLEDSPEIQTPSIPSSIKAILVAEHFDDNMIMVMILKPVADCFAKLESPQAHLGLIWESLIYCYDEIRSLAVPECFEDLRKHALAAVNEKAQEFHQGIYLAGFFLMPHYRKVFILDKHSLRDMVVNIITISRKWNPDMKLEEGKVIRDEIFEYYNNVGSFAVEDRNEKDYWKNLLGSRILAKFAWNMYHLAIRTTGVLQTSKALRRTDLHSRRGIDDFELTKLTRCYFNSTVADPIEDLDFTYGGAAASKTLNGMFEAFLKLEENDDTSSAVYTAFDIESVVNFSEFNRGFARKKDSIVDTKVPYGRFENC